MSMGKNFKKICNNKGYTQKYVAENIITQGSYSKFEDEQSDIKAETFLSILGKFYMSSSEFIFINNEYEYTEDEQILMNFFSLPYNDLDQLNLLNKRLHAYLSREKNIMLSDVLTICNALIELAETNDIESAQKIVAPVWDRLSRYNNWYLNDLKLINVLLYLFPVDTAIEVTKNLLKRLTQYKDFQGTFDLKFTLLINLTLLLIKSENYQEALNILDDTMMKYHKRMPFHSLALCFSRKSLCLHQLGNDSSDIYLKKAKQLLDIYEDNALWALIEKEYQKYTSEDNIINSKTMIL